MPSTPAHTGYTSSNGIPQLKEAIAAKLRDDGLDADADEVIVTPAASRRCTRRSRPSIDDGDEVVLLDPAWVSYEAMAKLAGADLSRVDQPRTGSSWSPRSMRSRRRFLTTPNCSSSTPRRTRQVRLLGDRLEGVRDLAVEHDIAVISDEIYEQITYDAEHVSLASLDGMADRTITINGFSKAYSMTDDRLAARLPPRPTSSSGRPASSTRTPSRVRSTSSNARRRGPRKHRRVGHGDARRVPRPPRPPRRPVRRARRRRRRGRRRLLHDDPGRRGRSGVV